jgi:CheY-like chemotaxis protein
VVKILIVDDRADNRFVLRDLLEPLGFEIIEAVGGRDALDKTTAFRPNLILMDLVMPDIDGFAATKQIRQIPELQGITIIAISAGTPDHTRQESLAAGCDDYIAKPFQVNDILEKLQRYLQLEWIYDETTAEVESTPLAEEPVIMPPPKAELEHLYELAMIGAIKKIQRQARSLAAQTPQFAPFAAKIDQLAGQFRLDEIQEFLEQYIARSEG